MTDALLPSALDCFDDIYRAGEGRRPALFLDYDGTLAPIAERPEEAVLAPGMLDAVRGLAQKLDVAIVSGRGLDDLRGRVGLDGIAYAGSHGFEIQKPDGGHAELEHAEQFLPGLAAVEEELTSRLDGYEGVLLDRKPYSLAIHYRLAPETLVPQVEDIVDHVVARAPELTKLGGKMVFEIRPDVDWHKGRAVQWLARSLGEHDSIYPMYIGDDVTDEDALRAMIGWGTGIYVGPADRVTSAHYALRDPAEVCLFLTRLLARIESRTDPEHFANG